MTYLTRPDRENLNLKLSTRLLSFSPMTALALERIKHAWPDAYRDFPLFVKIIVDMIDADFTSYSAAWG